MPAPASFTDSGMNKAWTLLLRHIGALRYVFTTVVPLIVRTGRRPVIFSRYTGMGDIVCTIPAARLLMARHPGATFIYNCHPDFAPMPRIAGVADHITTFRYVGIVGHWYRFLLGGFYHFAHGDDLPGMVAQEPMTAEFCRQFGLPATDQHALLEASSAALERVRALLVAKDLDPSQLILIHPGPSWTVKEWAWDHWVELVAELRARGYTNIAQLGVARYVAFQQVAVDTIPGAVSLVDQLSVEECLAAISLAKLFVGIDSGLLHIAASTRTPAVGLFGATSPQFFYGPHVRNRSVVSEVECAGCQHRLPRLHWITGCPYDVRCMKTLLTPGVLEACVEQLSEPRVP